MHPFPAGIRVQEWDMVSSYFKRFGDILKQTFEWISSQSIDIESHSQSKEPFSQTFKRDAQQFFQEIHIYDWKTQLQWYDVYKEAIHLLGLSSPQIKIPNSVYILTGAMNGLFSMDTFEDNEYSACEVNAWALLLNAVKLSKTLLDNIFMYKESWKQNIAVLWKHPNVSTLVIECLYRVIHPTVSLTLHKEYERLLVDFIQQLFYSFDSLSLIREYNYPIPEMSHYVVLLTEKDCKLFFSILYAVRLIHYQGSSSISENEKNTTNKASNELYYVTGIIKTLQNIADWSVLSSSSHRLSGKNSLSLGRIREILDDNTILKMNKVEYSDLNSYIPSELTEAQETTFQEDIVSNIYYPFWDADKRSARSLSLMTLLALCHASQSIENPESHEVIRIFLLQIVDVLRENEFKQEFYRVAEGQVRNRIEKWRKMKTFKRCLIPRPILTLEEEGFVKPYIDQLPNRKHAYVIMKALEIIDKPIPNKNRKSQAIYLTP
ncbi:hypothetical protein BDF14DRAFT_1745471 [Spinellus fusiger]|nr:hypothetical protein BDF14DRAFT_1745471 [Spinellus fusiger]